MMEKEFKYIEVEVSKTEYTTMYIKVPVDFSNSMLNNNILKKVTKDAWWTEEDYEWESMEVTEEDLEGAYNVYDMMN